MKQIKLVTPSPYHPITCHPGRDARGRFTKGNPYAHLGWQGLVRRRFNGNTALAKQWLGRVGVNAYARQFTLLTPMMRIRLETVYAYPGAPEDFIQTYLRRLQPVLPGLASVVDGLEFNLADLPGMEF